eukprot:COSAG02_NODE_1275_length_13506_cov_8.845603_5_plen_55_part_00
MPSQRNFRKVDHQDVWFLSLAARMFFIHMRVLYREQEYTRDSHVCERTSLRRHH